MKLKKNLISHALNICCKIYKTTNINIISNKNRKGNTIKAKRMFLYYLYVYMEVNHNQMKEYFDTINHATSIHHVKKFAFELETYLEVQDNFNILLNEMKEFSIYGEGFSKKRNEILGLLNEINSIK